LTFKTYDGSQPDESTELMPDILNALKEKGYYCYDESLFDIYVLNNNNSGKHVEIKVRLKSQRGSFPITKKQWILLNEIKKESLLNLNTKVLIYDAEKQQYSLTDLFEISQHLQSTKPGSTCYPRKSLFDKVTWIDADIAWNNLCAWLCEAKGERLWQKSVY